MIRFLGGGVKENRQDYKWVHQRDSWVESGDGDNRYIVSSNVLKPRLCICYV